MKSGLLKLCNLNTVLMLVILGLVIYCCVRQSRENFPYGLKYSILPRGEDGKFDPDSNAIAGYPSNVLYNGIGIEDLLEEAQTGRLTEEQINELIEARLATRQVTVNTQAKERAEAMVEKRERNKKIRDYKAAEEQYISDYLDAMVVGEGESKPSVQEVRNQLRGDDRSSFNNAPAYPTWDVMASVNDSTSIKGLTPPFSEYDESINGN